MSLGEQKPNLDFSVVLSMDGVFSGSAFFLGWHHFLGFLLRSSDLVGFFYLSSALILVFFFHFYLLYGP